MVLKLQRLEELEQKGVLAPSVLEGVRAVQEEIQKKEEVMQTPEREEEEFER
ncbi:hypothetical protein ACKX2L_06600 [Lachnospiraceae bacterium YH-ros2228]